MNNSGLNAESNARRTQGTIEDCEIFSDPIDDRHNLGGDQLKLDDRNLRRSLTYSQGASAEPPVNPATLDITTKRSLIPRTRAALENPKTPRPKDIETRKKFSISPKKLKESEKKLQQGNKREDLIQLRKDYQQLLDEKNNYLLREAEMKTKIHNLEMLVKDLKGRETEMEETITDLENSLKELEKPEQGSYCRIS